MKLLVLVILISISCASKPWKARDVSYETREWRFCLGHKDGPEKHKAGFCYNSQECRERFLRKDECRTLPLFCAWGDIPCMENYKLFDKKVR